MKKKMHLLVAVATVALIAAAAVGYARLLMEAGAAFNNLSASERRTYSVIADGTYDEAHLDNLTQRPVQLLGSVATADGQVLFDATDAYGRTDAATTGLLGDLGSLTVQQSQYILPNYADHLLPALRYNAVTGVVGAEVPDKLTLNLRWDLQQKMYQALHDWGETGSVAVYDYTTGEVLCLATNPGWQAMDDAGEFLDGAFINRNLGVVTPASTMKLVTMLLLVEQGFAPEELWFTCGSTHGLCDGNTVRCHGWHGSLNGVKALGVSCNCWFAQAIECLDVQRAAAVLRELGWCVNGEGGGSAALGRLNLYDCTVELHDRWDFPSVWTLIGLDAGLVSPVWMMEFVGALAAGDAAAQPRLMRHELPQTTAYASACAEELAAVSALWDDAYEGWYAADGAWHEDITCAKTGTVDQKTGDLLHDKRLAGYSEKYGVAFYIVTYGKSDQATKGLSAALMEALAETVGPAA